MAEKRNLNMKALENFRLVSRVSTRFAYFLSFWGLLHKMVHSQKYKFFPPNNYRSKSWFSWCWNHLKYTICWNPLDHGYFNQTKSINSLITANLESISALWIPHKKSEWATPCVIESRSNTEDFSLKFSNWTKQGINLAVIMLPINQAGLKPIF